MNRNQIVLLLMAAASFYFGYVEGEVPSVWFSWGSLLLGMVGGSVAKFLKEDVS